ncbi:hypothetical protein JKP88DRAFT_348934 [Tribonema minus]|uniref:Uncharacterized protein n=1 Tax=Tribonema minus TaxID=303371 RepID=A0A835YWX6_9STRA|nr:hypothetical protein JKP88DRAFT_348934 [Tribonema minus]
MGEASVSRRSFTSSVVLGGAAAAFTAWTHPKVAQAAAPEQTFEDAVATLMVCKAVLEPSHKYFKLNQFDSARTNVNYITRQLGVRKAIGKVIIEGGAICDDEALVEEASDLAATADSTFSNYDSSIYTVIFIPPGEDGSLPKGSDKYFNQADVYYDQSVHMLDVFISLAPEDVRERARAKAEARVKELPRFLFKEFTAAGRPATP